LKEPALAVLQHFRGILDGFHDWRSIPSPIQRANVFACSDASGISGGFIIFNADRTISRRQGIPWSAAQRSMHIFFKELLAATLLIEHLCLATKNCVLVIGIDNSAVAWVLRRLFSTTTQGQELVIRIYRALTLSSNRLDIRQILSEDNPSDVMTRRDRGHELPTRCERFWSVLDGTASISRKHKFHNQPPHDVIRHHEPSEDSDAEANDADPEDVFWGEMLKADDEVRE
jgi:hypothetical protein